MFAKALTDPKVQGQCLKKPAQTGVKGAKNLPKEAETYPFSLMNGLSGDICLLSDLLGDEAGMRMPGYEL